VNEEFAKELSPSGRELVINLHSKHNLFWTPKKAIMAESTG
jgi:hypothetical protein